MVWRPSCARPPPRCGAEPAPSASAICISWKTRKRARASSPLPSSRRDRPSLGRVGHADPAGTARQGSGKSEIVAFSGSFHGRLFATLAATDRPDYRKPFEPLVPGIRIIAREDWAAVDHAVSASRTAAVVVEPVQGEGGVRPVDAEWLGFLRELCDSRGVAVIFDEVQCGLGRTGTLFAYEQAGVVPDILTLAKPLAGGLPMGAVLVTSAVAAALKPGDHAHPFGGG